MKIKKVKNSLKLKNDVREINQLINQQLKSQHTNIVQKTKINQEFIIKTKNLNYEIETDDYNKTNMSNIRIYKKGVKMKKLRKSYKTKKKKAVLNLDKFIKSGLSTITFG